MPRPIDLTFERDIEASLDTVWACLTRPELIARWFFAVDFKPAVGHRFRISGQLVAGWRGWTDVEVLEVEAPRRMVWSFDCADGIEPGRVIFSLEQRPGFVRLLLRHEGLAPEATARLLDAGWSLYLDRLAELSCCSPSARITNSTP